MLFWTTVKIVLERLIVTTVDQPSLFSAADFPSPRSLRGKPERLQISGAALQTWKQRIFEFQRQIQLSPPAQQGSLFQNSLVQDSLSQDSFQDLLNGTGGDRLQSNLDLNCLDPNGLSPDSIDPFKLPQQNTEFWRWKAEDVGSAALYFVMDCQLPILLYVGETIKSNQRWKGMHDCKRYLLNYVTAHRLHDSPVAVNIGFWAQAPVQTRLRQQLELALIEKWRSPFNKENWGFWNTPFIGEK
jgi:hypothetical protein